jgi:hypothetical protein
MATSPYTLTGTKFPPPPQTLPVWKRLALTLLLVGAVLGPALLVA